MKPKPTKTKIKKNINENGKQDETQGTSVGGSCKI